MATATTAPALDGIDLDQLRAFENALHRGDFSFRLPVTPGTGWRAEDLAHGFNRYLEKLELLLSEISRVCREIGVQGKLGPQATHTFGPGAWDEVVGSVNDMASYVTVQIRDMNRTAKLMIQGDPTRPVTCPCQGETLELKNALNAIRHRLARE